VVGVGDAMIDVVGNIMREQSIRARIVFSERKSFIPKDRTMMVFLN